MHISGRDGTDFSPPESQGESDVEQPPRIGFPQSVKTRLRLAVFRVRGKHEWRIEKGLLDFGLADLVFVCTLTIVASVPIEPFDFFEVDHGCIFS